MEGSAGDDEVARYPNGSLLDIHQRSGIGSDWWMLGPYPTIPEVSRYRGTVMGGCIPYVWN